MKACFARTTRLRWVAVLLALMLSAAVLPEARAQNTLRYFSQTRHYLRGAFRSFWERNGGVATFGYPVTEEYIRNADGRIVQYFERARFELTINGNQAVVNLGRLGAEITGNRIFPQVPPFQSNPARLYFSETGHSLFGAFKSTWEARGRTAIFGVPISEEINEQLADGRWHTVQYFERARFELWPGGVRLGLLGRALAPAQLLAPWPPEAAPPGPLNENGEPRPPAPAPPTPVPPPPPAGDPGKLGTIIHQGLGVRGNGTITPLAAPAGVGFTFTAAGYDPAERVGVWLTRPGKGGVEAIDPRLVSSDGRGNIRVVFTTSASTEGIWTITGQGASTGRSVTAPFKLTRDYLAPLGTARPASRNGAVTPAEGGRSTIFALSGTGFRASEVLDLWITSPDGIYVLTSARADARGRIGYSPGMLVQFGAQNPTGVYGYHYLGTRSGRRVDLYFTFNGK
ncbi:MAG: hypothetical protein IPP13_20920 [Kouleothrix sp.]|jgi:hypothetical protein|nr:hypothetical protein [Kouleothrix sp.]